MTTEAVAQRASGRRSSVACFVVGCSYAANPDPNVHLPNTVNDASDFAAKMQSIGHEARLLTDPSLASFQTGFDEFVASLTEGTDSFFYYAGHGLQIGKQNYLVLADSLSLIAVSDVLTMLRQRARSVTLVLDACRDNPFVNAQTLSVAPTSRRLRTRSLQTVSWDGLMSARENGLAEMSIRGRGVKVVFSTDPGNVAVDGDPSARNSPFSAALVRHLGAKVSFDEVLARVTADVSQATNGFQTPWQQGSTDQTIFLAGAPASFTTGVNRMPVP